MKKILAYVIATAVVLFSVGAYAATIELSSHMLARAGIQYSPVQASPINHALIAHGIDKVMKIGRASLRRG
jgi:hypothetical protein